MRDPVLWRRAQVIAERVQAASAAKAQALAALEQATRESERVRTEAFTFALRHSGTLEAEEVYRALEVPPALARQVLKYAPGEVGDGR